MSTTNNINMQQPLAQKQKKLKIGSNCSLTLEDIKAATTGGLAISLTEDSLSEMIRSYDYLQSHINQRIPIYGINTQFGDQVNLVDHHIKSDDTNQYYDSINDRQHNLIKSHNCGLGDPVPSEIVRVAMLLRAHCLGQGYSGVHWELVETLIACLNAGILPRVPRYGSIGASGDLIPLATIAAALIGANVEVQYQDTLMPATLALSRAGIKPLNPKFREGLALINGTSFMTAIASISLYQLKRLFKQMLTSIAMTLESLMVIHSAYDPWIHSLKRQSGQQAINAYLNEFWQGSQLLSNYDARNREAKQHDAKSLQDYYSLRSVAQGFGPFHENLETAILWIEREMNSINDNPLVHVEADQILHGANFMGYYVTDACDILKMNIGQASTWLHALLANLVHPRKNHHLPANLVLEPARHNGFRPLQLLAASLAVQNRKLAQSHQAYSLPTEGDNQDVNSLGTHAALDFREAVDNLERLTAILLLASSQALELRGIAKASSRAQKVYHTIRTHSATVGECRVMHHELNQIVLLLREEKI